MPKNTQIDEMQNEVDALREILEKRISAMLAQNENLEELKRKTETLKEQSKVFKKSTHAMRKEMWKRNMKLKLLTFLGLAAVTLLLVMIALGSTGIVATPTVIAVVCAVFAAVALVLYIARLTTKVRYAKEQLKEMTQAESISPFRTHEPWFTQHPHPLKAPSPQIKSSKSGFFSKWRRFTKDPHAVELSEASSSMPRKPS